MMACTVRGEHLEHKTTYQGLDLDFLYCLGHFERFQGVPKAEKAGECKMIGNGSGDDFVVE
jgi:hypothetical protein